MANSARSTDLRDVPPSPLPAGTWDWQRAVRPHKRQPAVSPFRRRFNPITLGFWLGGIALATGGIILGGRMPYRHPTAVSISVLWWGIYLGCFGAAIGALLGLWAA
jgi:hypothetical protein